MKNRMTTLRREVLKDLGIDEALIDTLLTGTPVSVMEAGGSGGVYREAPDGAIPGGGGGVGEDLSVGYDHFNDTPSRNYGSGRNRFSGLDDYVNQVISQIIGAARVYPIARTDTSIKVGIRSTGAHPILFRDELYVYAGSEKDLTAHVPAPPALESDPPNHTELLLLLNPAELGNADPSVAVEIITDTAVIYDLTQWPTEKIPLAIVTLSSELHSSFYVADSDENRELLPSEITDVRPFLSWGKKADTWKEKDWTAATNASITRYRLDVGSAPRTPMQDYTRIFRNGQELTMGLDRDYTFGYDTGTNEWYIDLTFNVATGESLKAWYLEA